MTTLQTSRRMDADPRAYTYSKNLLSDRIVLITGASDGIGRALSLHAANHGARVILHGRNVSKLEVIHDEIESLKAAPTPSIAVMDLATASNRISGAWTASCSMPVSSETVFRLNNTMP